MDDLGDQGEVTRLLERRSDAELSELMCNLGGHDLSILLEAFAEAAAHDRPVCFLAYTTKGHGLPLAGHKDNHAGLMTPDQVDVLRTGMDIRPGCEWDLYEGLTLPSEQLQRFVSASPLAGPGRQRETPTVAVPEALPASIQARMSTQQGFGALLNEIGKTSTELAKRIVTTSPDVTVSTNLGGWVNRRGLFARRDNRPLQAGPHSIGI